MMANELPKGRIEFDDPNFRPATLDEKREQVRKGSSDLVRYKNPTKPTAPPELRCPECRHSSHTAMCGEWEDDIGDIRKSHRCICTYRPASEEAKAFPEMPGESEWVEIAKAHVAKHGTVSAEDIRKINEPYKDAILRAMDHPFAPPTQIPDAPKDLREAASEWYWKIENNRKDAVDALAEFAAEQISTAKAKWLEDFIAEVEAKSEHVTTSWGVYEVMRSVAKSYGVGGEDE